MIKSLLIFLFVFSFSAFSQQAVLAQYDITPDKRLEQMDVKVCFNQSVPAALFNGHYGRNTWLVRAVDAKNKALNVRRNRMDLTGVKAGECIEYQVKLNKGQQRRRALYRSGKDLIVNSYVWLWQPKGLTAQDEVVLNFHLPKGFNISTPWLSRAKHQFLLSTTPFYWDSRIAIGEFNVRKVKVAQQHLQLAILNSSAKRAKEYVDWIKQAASAVAGINGEYPVDNAQVIIVPIGKQREAVPWGEVQRGGSVAAHFFVDSERDIQQFKDDWTAAHELSHMLVPFIDRDELFLSEGIASYYQNVARAQAGMISETQAWDKLLAGFKRGFRAAKGKGREHTVADSGARMQLYWGGAALYLMADQALRRQTAQLAPDKQLSLAVILKRFNRCCQPSRSAWSGERLMAKFDQLAAESLGKSDIFISLYRQAQKEPFMPIIPVLNQLGFDGLSRNKLRNLAPAAREIMAD